MTELSTATLHDEYQRLAAEVSVAEEHWRKMERDFLDGKVLNNQANAACNEARLSRNLFNAWLGEHHAKLFAPSAVAGVDLESTCPRSSDRRATQQGSESGSRLDGRSPSAERAGAIPAGDSTSSSTAETGPQPGPEPTDREEIKQILQRACDRDWKDETLYQTAVIAANAIYWRDREIANLKKSLPSATAGVSFSEPEMDSLRTNIIGAITSLWTDAAARKLVIDKVDALFTNAYRYAFLREHFWKPIMGACFGRYRIADEKDAKLLDYHVDRGMTPPPDRTGQRDG